MKDALIVGLAMAVIFSCLYLALALIFTRDALRPYGGRLAAMRAVARAELLQEDASERLRMRHATVPTVIIDWATATPEARCEAVLDVLPTHFTDQNGISARDVAHRLGLSRPQQVTAALTRLRHDGNATSHWDRPKGRRVYWRVAD